MTTLLTSFDKDLSSGELFKAVIREDTPFYKDQTPFMTTEAVWKKDSLRFTYGGLEDNKKTVDF